MSRFVMSGPHKDLSNPFYQEWIAFLRESEAWSLDQITAYQVENLDRVVRLAATRTKGYGQLYAEHGVADLRIATPADLKRLPVVTKEMIRDRLEDFTIPSKDNEYVTTGGSTGIPFGFYRTKQAFGRELASKAYQYHRIGWREGDRQIVFRGLVIDTPEKYQYFPEFNELRFSSYHLSDEDMHRFHAVCMEYQPQWLRCYPSSAQIFAQFLQSNGLSLPSLKGLLCASENLYDFQRKLFKEAYGGRVFSHYGHYELAVLAGYCEARDTYHLLPQYGFAELLDEAGRDVTARGASGEIVATSYFMTATPFIRYRTNDFATFESAGCPACGRPHDVWEDIAGRLQDFVITGDGRPISMTAINMHDDIFDRLKQFQFEQSEPGKVTFHFVPKSPLSAEEIADIHRRLMIKFGSAVSLAMNACQDIPATKRGKHRFLQQHLPLTFGDGGVQTLFSNR
jgi:phenylacetate-CoA ligase